MQWRQAPEPTNPEPSPILGQGPGTGKADSDRPIRVGGGHLQRGCDPGRIDRDVAQRRVALLGPDIVVGLHHLDQQRRGRERSHAVTVDAILEAKEQLIVRREVHLDQLTDKLQEERVRRVVEPLLSGGDERAFTARDLEYVRDLGLVAWDTPLRIANLIYAEVVPRELTWAAQKGRWRTPRGTSTSGWM